MSVKSVLRNLLKNMSTGDNTREKCLRKPKKVRNVKSRGKRRF